MQDIWNRIETWLKANAPPVFDNLNPPATEEEIRNAEAFLGITFPEDVRASFLIHNGEKPEGYHLIDFGLLPLDLVLDEWKGWKELIDSGDLDYESEPEIGIKPDWWNPKWIPITDYGFGDSYCLDLDPTPDGQVGQILLMWHDDYRRPLIAKSYRAWLQKFADDLEAGEYILPDGDYCLMRKDEV